MSEEEELTKVVVDLPNHWATGGESMWAKWLMEDLYELRNVPFYAYGLAFADVVRADAPAPDMKPVVRELVRPSGHRTLRVFFLESFEPSERVTLLRDLNPLGASFERATPSLFAIDVEPQADYDGVCQRLVEWASRGILDYETCEPRVEGSFDDDPDDDDPVEDE